MSEPATLRATRFEDQLDSWIDDVLHHRASAVEVAAREPGLAFESRALLELGDSLHGLQPHTEADSPMVRRAQLMNAIQHTPQEHVAWWHRPLPNAPVRMRLARLALASAVALWVLLLIDAAASPQPTVQAAGIVFTNVAAVAAGRQGL